MTMLGKTKVGISPDRSKVGITNSGRSIVGITKSGNCNSGKVREGKARSGKLGRFNPDKSMLGNCRSGNEIAGRFKDGKLISGINPDKSKSGNVNAGRSIDGQLNSGSVMAGIWKFGRVHHLGISALALYAPPIEITTEYRPDGTGEYFNYGDMLLGLTYALRMTDRFSFGLTTKWVEEQLADLTMRNVVVDLGTYYRTGYKDLRFAVALLNFGSPASPGGKYADTDSTEAEYEAYAPPTIFRLGVAHDWLDSKAQEFTTTVQLNHPVDNVENISLGLEYGYRGMIFLRSGYHFGDEVRSWTVGLGLEWSGFSFGYSYADMADLNRSEHFTLGWSF